MKDWRRFPNVESITSDIRASNCNIIENIPPKRAIFSDFICTLAKSDEDLWIFISNTESSGSSDKTKHWVKHYYSMLWVVFFRKVLRDWSFNHTYGSGLIRATLWVSIRPGLADKTGMVPSLRSPAIYGIIQNHKIININANFGIETQKLYSTPNSH